MYTTMQEEMKPMIFMEGQKEVIKEETDIKFTVDKEKKETDKKLHFLCEHCDLKIVKSNFYVKHVQEQHEGSSLLCCFCTERFVSGEQFLEHVKLHGRNKTKDPTVGVRFPKTTFQCGECDKKVVKSTAFVKHVLEEHGGGKFLCSFCTIYLDSGEEFVKHVKSVHGQSKVEKLSPGKEEGDFPCVECKKVFKTINYLQCHNRTVHQIQVTVCEYCCKEFKNRDYYKKHVKLVHEAHFGERQACDQCEKTFKSKANLYHHKKSVHETSENMICYICASVSKNEQALRKHVRKCEMKANKGPNPLPFGVYSEDILVEGDKFICKHCQKVKPSLKSLTAHIRVAHTHDPVPCHLCSNHLKNVDYLKKHYKVKHFITDINTINQYVRMIKPEHEPNLVRQKNKQIALDRVSHSYGKETEIVETKSSELKKQREEMVKKWRQMEEEQTSERHLEETAMLKVEHLSEFSVENRAEVNIDTYPSVDKVGEAIKSDTNMPVVKTEDDHVLPECEVKLEASDDEDSGDYDTEKVDNEVKHEQSESESSCDNNDGDESLDNSIINTNKDFECKSCGKRFNSQRSLSTHMQFVHIEEPCACKICGVKFKNPKYLQKHLLRSHKDDPSVTVTKAGVGKDSFSGCEVPAEFGDAGLTRYKCPECSKIFEGLPKLKAHVKNVHTYGSYLCPECGKEFILKQQLKNHMNNHHNVDRLTGKTCELCCKVVRNLKRHTKEMHSDEQFVCPVCAKTFRSRNQLRNHTTSVHPDEERTVHCPTCGKSFANSYYMKKHLRLVHGNLDDTPQVSCEECGKQFANEVYMHHHKKYAHEVENSVCEICNRSYKNKRALQRHMRYAHSGKDTYPSPNKSSPPLATSPHSHQKEELDSTSHSIRLHPGTQPPPPPSTPPQHHHAVSPPASVPSQWYDQHSSVPIGMATSQLELARQQLQYRQMMQMDSQEGQWHHQHGQGWFPRLYQ